MPNKAVETSVGRMTVAELAAYSGRRVREIIEYAFGDETGADPEAAVFKIVETRTAAGRYTYDQAVFAVLEAQGRAMSALEIRVLVGGTPQQLRASLARLAQDEIVVASGQAAATRYALA